MLALESEEEGSPAAVTHGPRRFPDPALPPEQVLFQDAALRPG